MISRGQSPRRPTDLSWCRRRHGFTAVDFGSTAATSFNIVSDTEITAVTPAESADPRHEELRALRGLPVPDMMRAFLARQVKPGVVLPAPPEETPPPWMALRPAGVLAFIGAAEQHVVREDRYRAFRAPVYYSYGSLSSEEWAERRSRLAALFGGRPGPRGARASLALLRCSCTRVSVSSALVTAL